MKRKNVVEEFLSGKISNNKNELIIDEIKKIILEGNIDKIEKKTWFAYLDFTSRPEYLESLRNMEKREEWANQVFSIIQHTEYSLLDMFEQRLKEMPEKILFQDMSKKPTEFWSFESVNRLLRQYAAIFYQTSPKKPRVAIYADNCVHSAITDLACLFYDIFDTPLSTHFKVDVLVPIFDLLEINIAVCDTEDRLESLMKLRQFTRKSFSIFSYVPLNEEYGKNIYFIGNSVLSLSNKAVDEILSKRKRKPINQVATTMFTSGSTGVPKGVSFSIYNLVSKRFARHAALPFVGKDESLLCFLPLYHTFGRFLELLGMVYWRGIYTFTGNSSPETLLELFSKTNPSGFISVPIRWLQLYEAIQEKMLKQNNNQKKELIIRSVVGSRLKWGLSAAGYLDPRIFTFFEKNGINICSGFGMTEATGGITMTPPGNYRKKSTGILLPGTYSQIIEQGELILSGHYIARYLEDKGPEDIIEYPGTLKKEYWLKTGDVFKVTNDGYYEIIDRVKDIYKNSKGQTVAPKSLEKKFEGVPGIKQTFLVGDGQPFNVLLIVPDLKSPVVINALKEGTLNEYFHQIVMQANKDMANFERVVNFSVVSREFSADKGEITPKGSFNRKNIQKNYKGLIESLYQTNHIKLNVNEINLIIPRWFYRDIGILENDIIVKDEMLYDRRNKKKLNVKKIGKNQVLIGDLVYTISDDFIDIGRLTRQPRLWVGNPELIAFAPIKEGWDLPLKGISHQVSRLKKLGKSYKIEEFPTLKENISPKLKFLNDLVCKSIFCEGTIALQSALELGQMLNSVDLQLDNLLRRRLEVLAYHQQEEVRALAYKTLILAEPDPDFDQILPAFINSGLPFLTEESIHEIAMGDFGMQHLVSLRKRLYYYRSNMEWPTSEIIREQFKNTLKLLFNFGCKNIAHYMPIRSEMASWILHENEPELSKLAEKYFFDLFYNFENWLRQKTPKYTKKDFDERVVYETGISRAEKEKLDSLFIDTLFLDQSVVMAYEELDFNLLQVPPRGMWISRLISSHKYRHYRLSINTLMGKHYELHLVVSVQVDPNPNYEQLYWLSSLSGHPFGTATLPAVGCSRLKVGIRTTKFLGELTAWERIKEYSEIDNFSTGNIKLNDWRKLFIKALSVFFVTLKNSNFRKIPGLVSPNNVVVPVMDFRESAKIVSLSGMADYNRPIDVLSQIIKEFYEKTEAHYPWVKGQILKSWIFDACFESFDPKTVYDFFRKLAEDLEKNSVIYGEDGSLGDDLKKYMKNMHLFYFPQSLHNAIDRYYDWEKKNASASCDAKEQTIFELYELYKLQDLPQVVRYYLFRNTYFAKSGAKLLNVFDQLIQKMRSSPLVSPMQLIELSDLQSLMKSADDKSIFSKMVFPKIQKEQSLNILKVKADTKEQIIVRSILKDKTGEEFDFREPIEASEVGQLYQLFSKENYPLNITKMDRHYVICDKNERIVGGLCFKILEDKTVLLNGGVVNSPLKARGIGSAMVDDFFTRMASFGFKLVKAHFLLGNYYLKNKFQADKKWGAFVKYL
jgi:long-subunit acyl-CoA synthetase (AMP-forming)